jgi:hypothetical protein
LIGRQRLKQTMRIPVSLREAGIFVGGRLLRRDASITERL